MNADTVATVCATILLVAIPVAIVTLVVPDIRATLVRYVAPATAAVPVLAMAGSLYFSERAGFVPCELCWYQRIAMYPLAAILPIAAVRRDRSIHVYATPLAVVGLGIAAYHTYIQAFPAETNFCEIDNPCTAQWVDAYGIFSIPAMAGLSFLLILLGTAITVVHERSPR